MFVPRYTVFEVLGRRLFRVFAFKVIGGGKKLRMHVPANHADWCPIGSTVAHVHCGIVKCMPIIFSCS